jgi:hypothetical protein
VSTEREVLDALYAVRYSQRFGNGYRWAYAEQVRSGSGLVDGKRIADAVAMDLWPSKGQEIHGHEVKVSRSDWLCELRDAEKAEAFRPYMSRWWLVVPDAAIVRDDLPEGWGLILANWTTVRVLKRAPRLDPKPLPRPMLGALLRATEATRRPA